MLVEYGRGKNKHNTEILAKREAMRAFHYKSSAIAGAVILGVKFDLESRDGMSRLLMGLQKIYKNEAMRDKLLKLLEEQMLPCVSKTTGRPGMPLWTILVCGAMRLELNTDWDQLEFLINGHRDIRGMLGHDESDDHRYGFRSLRENVRLLTPNLNNEISKLVVEFGHGQLKPDLTKELHARCDSFVVETNIHFPTDISLLLDAMRKIISLMAQWCERHQITDWRQYRYNIRHIKKLMRAVQNKKHNKGKLADLSAEDRSPILLTYQNYLNTAAAYLAKAQVTVAMIGNRYVLDDIDTEQIKVIESFMKHAVRQIDHTTRRVINGEVIPSWEKVYSVFEEYTEWKSKGKVGILAEMGLAVAVVEDQHGFILHHRVMKNECDADITVQIIKDAISRFPTITQCSFDKGFHSKPNQIDLKPMLKRVVLPRKGKLSKEAMDEEHAEYFVKARRAHSAVESAINALEVHGLDVCPDRGIEGFERYVSLAVVARNIHRLGDILWEKARKQERRRNSRSANDPQSKLAA